MPSNIEVFYIMAKKEYKFNPQTLSYDVVSTPSKIRLYRVLRRVLIGFLLASVVNFIFSHLYLTPKMSNIIGHRRELLLKYKILNDKIEASNLKIKSIKHRDNNVYRQLFVVDTLEIHQVYEEYPESKYESFKTIDSEGVVLSSWKKLDAITKLLYLESKSFDQLQELTQNKGLMAMSIPAIWPLDKSKLTNVIGAYGMRMHPIYRRYIHHNGIDLTVPKGTPIYATGDGVVDFTRHSRSRRGYGNEIILEHGFGYKTQYAHLDSILVKEGQKVKRGEIIGKAGRTGGTTGPHLHYEVRYKGKHVDALNYFRRDMTEEEFEKIVKSAKATTYELLEENQNER